MNTVISFPYARQLAPDVAAPPRRAPHSGGDLDVAALLAAAQAFAGELLTGPLVERIAAVMREEAGASQAVLILSCDGRQRVVARATASGGVDASEREAGPADVPLTLLASTTLARRAVVLNHAQLIDCIVDDPYLRERAPQAVLCLPLIRQQELLGLLYLEHTDVASPPRLFSRECIAALDLLAGHAAIALGNSRRHQQVLDENRQLRQAAGGLRRAQAELARAARVTTMGELAASIAHEVNQPLSAIALNAGAGLNWLKREPPDLKQVRNALELVAASASRAGEIVRSIRGLARRSGPETTDFVVDDALREVLILLRSEAQQQGIAVDSDLALAGRSIRADRPQLQQVILNLLMNAIEAIAAHAHPRQRRIAIRSWMEQGQLRVSVEDSGIGLPAASIERVFEALFSTKRDGMGMGLSICRSIVEAHGGRIWCGDGALGGAAFHLRLPPAPALAPGAPSCPCASGGRA